MDGFSAPTRCLYERGLSVDLSGVALGPDCVLVRRTAAGYERAGLGEIVDLTRAVFGRDARLDRIPILLTRITEALAAGDLPRAQALGREIPIDALDERQLARLRFAGDAAAENASGSAPDLIVEDHDLVRRGEIELAAHTLVEHVTIEMLGA
jgi:hypothetical protein